MTAEFSTVLAGRLAALRRERPHAYPRDYAAALGVSEAELAPIYYAGRVQAVANLEAALTFVAQFSRVKLMARTSFAVLEAFTTLRWVRKDGLFIAKNRDSFLAINPAELGQIYFLSAERESENSALLFFDRKGVSALKLYFPPVDGEISLLHAPASPVAEEPPSAATQEAIEAQRVSYVHGVFSSCPLITPRQLIEDTARQSGALVFELVTPALGFLLKHRPQKIADARGWFNILDADFNLHLKEDAVATCTAAAAEQITRLQLHNVAGETIAIYGMGANL